MSTPFNQEHIDAVQETVNKKKSEILQKLSDGEKNKFLIVEEAVNFLVKNKIKFYLFPELESIVQLDNGEYKKYKTIWQYNSLNTLAEYDESGKVTDKTKISNSVFNEAFMYCLYCTFSQAGADKTTPWTGFLSYLLACITNRFNYLKNLFEDDQQE